jgi:hypothetical protein
VSVGWVALCGVCGHPHYLRRITAAAATICLKVVLFVMLCLTLKSERKKGGRERARERERKRETEIEGEVREKEEGEREKCKDRQTTQYSISPVTRESLAECSPPA